MAFWAVIPAGGAGTRLWPLSTPAHPKFLLDLTGSGRTLLQQTWDRLVPIAGDRIIVVTGEAHVDAVRAQLPDLAAENLIAEPAGRDSMAAIGVAAAIIEHRDLDAVIGSFAADHVIGQTDLFHQAVALAIEVAADDLVVTIGITPTFASTAFGYIEQADELPGHPGACAVKQFVEKPSAEVAEHYLATGRFRWNAGMFVAGASTLLELLAESDAEFSMRLRVIGGKPSRLAEIWPTLPKIAIDYAIAEPAAAKGRVAVVPAAFDWDDVGDFNSLARVLPGTEQLKVLGDDALVRVIDSSGLIVPASGRTISVIGLDDVIVVDTAEGVLVTTRARAQEVKQVVASLKEVDPDLT